MVTGAASGIGAATAALLDKRGYRVIDADLHDATITVDLATPDGRARLVDEVDRLTNGRVDAVIANAGTIGQGANDVRVNFFGAVATLTGLRPLLARGTDPRAVVTSSQALIHDVNDDVVTACLAGDEEAAVAALPSEPSMFDATWIYASTKRALGRWVRREAPTEAWAGAGIALNAVAPGVIRTPMTEPLLADPGMTELLLAMTPMPLGGVAEPDAVAHVMEFLSSADTTAVSGQILFVDGGGECTLRGDDVWSAR